MSGWHLPLAGLFFVASLIGLVYACRSKSDEVIRDKPFNDPRAAIHNNFTRDFK